MSEKVTGVWQTPPQSPIVMTFGNLVVPRQKIIRGKPTGEPIFSVTLLLTPDSEALTSVKEVIQSVANAKWPGVDMKTLHPTLKSGTKRADKAKENKKDREYERGLAVILADAKSPPSMGVLDDGLLDPTDKPFTKGGVLDLQSLEQRKRYESRFYPGAQVLVGLNFVPYDAIDEDGKPTVKAYLNSILSFNKGERLFGARLASEVFKGVVGHVSNEDPGEVDEEAF